MIGHKLLIAFNSPSGLPFTDINPHKKTSGLSSYTQKISLSEAGTLQLEFNELAILLGDRAIAVSHFANYLYLWRFHLLDLLHPR